MTTIIINFNNATQSNLLDMDELAHYSVGFLYKVLGEDLAKKYHDMFGKPFSISQLRCDHRMCFPDKHKFGMINPHIIVHSLDDEFTNALLERVKFGISLPKMPNVKVVGINRIDRYFDDKLNHNISGNDLVKFYSPVLLRLKFQKEDGTRFAKTITPHNNKDYYKLLTEHCRRKLSNASNLTQQDIDSLEITPNPKGCELQFKRIKFEGHNIPTSLGIVKVKGTPNARRILYHLGIGNSCGCGFGNVGIVSGKQKMQKKIDL